MLVNMKTHPRFDPVIGFDINADACDDMAEKTAGFNIVTNSQAFFDIDNIDLLYVSTPPKSHAEFVYGGLDKGWNIFCEKPLGISVEASEKLSLAIKEHAVMQAVNFVFSGAPALHAARWHISNGLIGTPIGAELTLKFSTWPRGWQAHAAWLGGRNEGGMMREVGSHYAYLTRELLGSLDLEAPLIREFPAPDQAETMVMAQWKSGHGFVSVNARVGGNRQDIVRYRVLGDQGCLVFENWYQLFHETSDGLRPLLDPTAAEPLSAYMGQLDQLALQLDDGRKRLADFADALAVQRLIEAMIR
jgi:predicted dehydrogenase